jgi:hypothetical protein
MPLTFDPLFGPAGPRRAVPVSIPEALHTRLASLRRRLEDRFRIRLGDDDLIEYLCEKALERMEEWERRTRPPSGPLA